jgi:hypothetical protein
LEALSTPIAMTDLTLSPPPFAIKAPIYSTLRRFLRKARKHNESDGPA